MILGCHCGMSGTEMMLGSVKEAIGYNATALMIYTGAPQNTIRKQLKDLHIAEALKLMDEANISREHLIIHAPYIINPATTDLIRFKEYPLFASPSVSTNKIGVALGISSIFLTNISKATNVASYVAVPPLATRFLTSPEKYALFLLLNSEIGKLITTSSA